MQAFLPQAFLAQAFLSHAQMLTRVAFRYKDLQCRASLPFLEVHRWLQGGCRCMVCMRKIPVQAGSVAKLPQAATAC